MSLINATLVAQAIHFSVAFILIKYFLCKPVFAQIDQEDKLQESLIATVQSHQQAVAQKEQELIAQWHALRNYFGQHVPFIRALPNPFDKGSQIHLPHLNQQEVDNAIKQATQEIVKKVNNVW